MSKPVTAFRLRTAGAADWQAWFGAPPPPHWFGIAADAGFMLLGIGGAYVGLDGRWWAMAMRAPGVRCPVLLQRAAKLTLGIAEEAGLDLFARADPRIAGSALWLGRLGFIETDEMVGELKVWRWGRNSFSEQHC